MDFTSRPDERYEIRLSRTGGQGIITAGMIIAETCAIYGGERLDEVHGKPVSLSTVMTQSYGPEARGGACKAELVFSLEEIDAPKPEKVDLLLALSQEAYDKYRKDVKDWGMIVVDSSTVKFEQTKNTFAYPFTSVAREQVGFAVTANIVAVGYIAGLTLQHLASPENFKAVIAKKIPPGTEGTNYKAFDLGYKASTENLHDVTGVGKFMKTNLIAVSPETMAEDAIKTAIEKGTEAVFVIENGEYAGHFSFFRAIRAVGRGLDLGKTPISEIMIKEVLPCKEGDFVEQVLDVMEENYLKIMPVVDDKGKLIGYLNYYQIQESQFSEEQMQNSMDFVAAARTMITGNKWSMLRAVVHNMPRTESETTVEDAASKMFSRRADCIIIVDEDDKPIGIFTELDLVKRVIAKGLNPARTKIGKVMTKKVQTMSTSDTVIDAFAKMVKGKFHHVPVVGQSGKLKGVVNMQSIAAIINSKFYLQDSMSQEMPTTD